jgi:hypothetical protein
MQTDWCAGALARSIESAMNTRAKAPALQRWHKNRYQVPRPDPPSAVRRKWL